MRCISSITKFAFYELKLDIVEYTWLIIIVTLFFKMKTVSVAWYTLFGSQVRSHFEHTRSSSQPVSLLECSITERTRQEPAISAPATSEPFLDKDLSDRVSIDL